MPFVTAKAIPTKYAGHFFRSRLEARWAVFFNTCGIKWEYEPEGYALPSGPYLPDFWLPEVSLRGPNPGVWGEVKPEYPNDEDERKAVELSGETGYPVIILAGQGFLLDNGTFVGYQIDATKKTDGDDAPCNPKYPGYHVNWDDSMSLLRCTMIHCRHVKFEYREASYWYCPKCGAWANNFPFHNAAIAAQCERFDRRP